MSTRRAKSTAGKSATNGRTVKVSNRRGRLTVAQVRKAVASVSRKKS